MQEKEANIMLRVTLHSPPLCANHALCFVRTGAVYIWCQRSRVLPQKRGRIIIGNRSTVLVFQPGQALVKELPQVVSLCGVTAQPVKEVFNFGFKTVDLF